MFAEKLSHDFAGNFFRVTVSINVTKPLKNGVSMIKAGKRHIFWVKFERLLD